jgi:hypothetical protein
MELNHGTAMELAPLGQWDSSVLRTLQRRMRLGVPSSAPPVVMQCVFIIKICW